MSKTQKNDRVQPILEAIRKLGKTPAYRITLTEQENLSIFSSKLGGLPYWNLEKPYPCDKKGTPLLLLLQLNFEEAGLNDTRLPKDGMLQFFIADDDTYGLDFNAPETQNTFRVVYHKALDHSVTEEALRALSVPVMPGDLTPVDKECALSFAPFEDSIGLTDFRFDAVFQQAVKQATGEDTQESIYDYFTDEEYNRIGKALMAEGHKLLGCPFFTQYDPRECTADFETYYDTLLLQLDSEYTRDRKLMLWGDTGIAQFFINSKALEECDFSRVLYNWDCY